MLAENDARDGALARDLVVPQAVVQAVLEGLKMTSVAIVAPSSKDGFMWQLIGSVDQALEAARKLGVLDMSLEGAARSERLANLDQRLWLLQNQNMAGMSGGAEHVAHRLAYEYARAHFSPDWSFPLNHGAASGELAARGLIEQVGTSGEFALWRFTAKGRLWAVDDAKR
jgi:hypothetical protein